MSNWRAIQQQLADKGFDPGPIDGVPGRRTLAAVKSFQKAVGLPATGQADAETLGKLFTGSPAQPDVISTLPWMATAKSLLGTMETPGPKSNPTILDWADDLDLHYPGDDIAWCGLFVGHCIGSTLPDEPLPVNPLGARNWLRAGVPIKTPSYGAIAVFWRESRQSFKGHVGFLVAQSATSFKVLGGNQKDSVSYAWIDRDRLLGFRWPKTYDLPHVISASESGGPLSHNEA